jgi:hypothetical protein
VLPAGLVGHMRQSGRCRAAKNGNEEQGEPQQNLTQLAEDAKQQAGEGSQGSQTQMDASQVPYRSDAYMTLKPCMLTLCLSSV